MRLISWNINSVLLRISLLKKLVEGFAPDLICLQETKTTNENFPAEDIKNLGYEFIAFDGEKSYNGVAILSKHPIEDVFSLKFYNQDKRHIACKINDIEIHNFYIPAGGDEPDIEVNPKFKHKLEYIKLAQNWFASNRCKTDKIILAGDLNIAPHEHDVWSSKQLRNVVSHTDIERSLLLELQKSFHFIDSARHLIPMDKKLYSWWSYRNKDWAKSNRGRRLDHIWLSMPLKHNLKQVVSLKEARSWERPSDHVPYIVDLEL